jgi:hypothetical protein
VDGQNDRFAAPDAKPPEFGFFGGASSAPGSAYGPPPAQQFGAPAQPATQPFGAPYATPPAPASNKTRTGVLIGAAVLALVAVAVAAFGWNFWKQHQAIGIPTNLGGLAQNHEPGVEQLTASALAGLKKDDPGKKAGIAAYGSISSKDLVFFVGIRGRLASIEKDFAQGGASGVQQHIGHNTCGTIANGIMCERTSTHLTAAVISVSSPRTMAQVSALLDEAWKQA